jgi:hypothetical protein
MRECTVPKPIQFRNPFDGQPGEIFDIRRVAWQLWLTDSRWSNPKPRLAWYVKVCDEFNKKPGEVMRFEDSWWEVLCEIIDKPEKNPQTNKLRLYEPHLQVQVGEPFERIILGAVEVGAAQGAGVTSPTGAGVTSPTGAAGPSDPTATTGKAKRGAPRANRTANSG